MTNKLKTILFLLNDTDVVLMSVIKAKFQKDAGWDSMISTNYDEAIKCLDKKNPDAVLTEIIINDHKGRTGFDFIEEINYLGKKDKLKVIIFTELGLDEDKQKALALGVKHYFIKSKIALNGLIDEIKKIII